MCYHRRLFGLLNNTRLTSRAIRSKYYALAARHHPDVEGGDEETMKKINAAYKALMRSLGHKKNMMMNLASQAPSESRTFVFVCRKCTKAFTDMDSLKLHLDLDHPEWYPCPECKRLFPTPACLSRHVLKSHHKCPHCSMTFSRSRAVANHVATYHNSWIHLLARHKAYHHKCPHCPKTFRKSIALARHVVKYHI